MTSEELVGMLVENKNLVIRFYEIINSGKYDQLDSILNPHVVWHDPLLPEGEVRGSENFKNVLKMFRVAFPGLHVTVQDQIVEHAKVVTRFSIHGTHRGELMGSKPTGKQFTITGISVIRFFDGRIVEEWIEEDGLGLMRQLGLNPMA